MERHWRLVRKSPVDLRPGPVFVELPRELARRVQRGGLQAARLRQLDDVTFQRLGTDARASGPSTSAPGRSTACKSGSCPGHARPLGARVLALDVLQLAK
jgi:hypothetical protein